MSAESQQTASSQILETLQPKAEEQIYVASQWQLMRWKFQKHKMAIVGGIVLIVFYTLAIFCEFFAPYDPLHYDAKLIFLSPRIIRLWDEDGLTAPFVYGIKQNIDPVSFRRTYVEDTSIKHNVKLFARGQPYKMWGLF